MPRTSHTQCRTGMPGAHQKTLDHGPTRKPLTIGPPKNLRPWAHQKILGHGPTKNLRPWANQKTFDHGPTRTLSIMGPPENL
ncbi:hypothetical protein XELAEV_18013818mg [Xenopus laevis]|uniref:Uncharacterized protein n=1 Tax=Xenopus laevis TaxID=8355 RepID=A0A974DRF7_XENLA|nr:hypothetical protein XELAEV_18013818mg [Xenopus laevis]